MTDARRAEAIEKGADALQFVEEGLTRTDAESLALEVLDASGLLEDTVLADLELTAALATARQESNDWQFKFHEVCRDRDEARRELDALRNTFGQRIRNDPIARAEAVEAEVVRLREAKAALEMHHDTHCACGQTAYNFFHSAAM